MRVPRRWIIAAAMGAMVATPAAAHVPERCVEFYQTAGWESVLVNKTGQEVVDQQRAGLDMLAGASRDRLAEEYLDLVDAVSRFLERKMALDLALTEAIECTAGGSP